VKDAVILKTLPQDFIGAEVDLNSRIVRIVMEKHCVPGVFLSFMMTVPRQDTLGCGTTYSRKRNMILANMGIGNL
jgi:hypothetical protein